MCARVLKVISMSRKTFLFAASLCLAASATMAQTPVHIRGTIMSLDGNVLHVKTNDSAAEKTVTLGPKLKVSAVISSSLAEVKPGSFIGTAAQTQADGSLVAREVHVFPEAMRGAGEGHRSFDLGPKSTMTNGTVGQEVVGTTGRSLTVTYKGGEKTIVVPPDVPVVTFEPGDRAELIPGAHVIVFARSEADGALSSEQIAVGKDGLTPPM